MDLCSTVLNSVLFFLGLCGICTGFLPENCTNYTSPDGVFSVPGDMAMLNSTLVSFSFFDFKSVPYNITWCNSKTGQEISNQTGRILVLGETLWFLNVTQDDDGEYVTIVRTPTLCYTQSTKLVVDLPGAGECGKPKKARQNLTKGVTDTLSCPLKNYISKLKSYNIPFSITWYRGCDRLGNETGRHTLRTMTDLKIDKVETEDKGSYTCTLTFTHGGINGSVSETIHVEVKEEHLCIPQLIEPANEIIKAELGSKFTKRCLVFVPCVTMPKVDIFWSNDNENPGAHLTERVYMSEPRVWSQDGLKKGVWLEQLLIFSELREEDFHVSYTCRAYSARGSPNGYFSLLPQDPNFILPIGLVLGGVTVLFIISVIIYYLFKIDIVLWFRRAFPVLYTNTDLDGKLYDAYVAYPPPCAVGYSNEVETFAIHALPQVLEKACGYKLFIAGRDCLPGKATVDSVEENIQASRCLLLVYTASTFISQSHTRSTSGNNNNNISKNSNCSDNTENKNRDSRSSVSSDGDKEVYPDTRQQLECVAAMHRVLLEGSLKVVLVELEEITPGQLPPSVRHLRKKQGAVCWWKNQRPRQRWRTCTRESEDEEKSGQGTQLSPSLSPSVRFWKEMRYHMPGRGRRAVNPEETALLNDGLISMGQLVSNANVYGN